MSLLDHKSTDWQYLIAWYLKNTAVLQAKRYLMFDIYSDALCYQGKNEAPHNSV